jgi:hypothetical protein
VFLHPYRGSVPDRRPVPCEPVGRRQGSHLLGGCFVEPDHPRRVVDRGQSDEREAPAGREPIRWRLLTDLPVDDLPCATEKHWYVEQFKIETFHKVLKSGSRTEGPGSARPSD